MNLEQTNRRKARSLLFGDRRVLFVLAVTGDPGRSWEGHQGVCPTDYTTHSF